MKTQRQIRKSTQERFSGISIEASIALENRRAAMEAETVAFMLQDMDTSKFGAEKDAAACGYAPKEARDERR